MFIFACYHIDVGLEKMIWSLWFLDDGTAK